MGTSEAAGQRVQFRRYQRGGVAQSTTVAQRSKGTEAKERPQIWQKAWKLEEAGVRGAQKLPQQLPWALATRRKLAVGVREGDNLMNAELQGAAEVLKREEMNAGL